MIFVLVGKTTPGLDNVIKAIIASYLTSDSIELWMYIEFNNGAISPIVIHLHCYI